MPSPARLKSCGLVPVSCVRISAKRACSASTVPPAAAGFATGTAGGFGAAGVLYCTNSAPIVGSLGGSDESFTEPDSGSIQR